MGPQPQLSLRHLVLCIELHRTTTSYPPAEIEPRNVFRHLKTLRWLTFRKWIEKTEFAPDANLTHQMENFFTRLFFFFLFFFKCLEEGGAKSGRPFCLFCFKKYFALFYVDRLSFLMTASLASGIHRGSRGWHWGLSRTASFFNCSVAIGSQGYGMTGLCVVLFLRSLIVMLTSSSDETDTTGTYLVQVCNRFLYFLFVKKLINDLHSVSMEWHWKTGQLSPPKILHACVSCVWGISRLALA